MDERDADIFVDQAARCRRLARNIARSQRGQAGIIEEEYATMAGWLRSGKRTGAQSKEASAAAAPVHSPRQ